MDFLQKRFNVSSISPMGAILSIMVVYLEPYIVQLLQISGYLHGTVQVDCTLGVCMLVWVDFC